MTDDPRWASSESLLAADVPYAFTDREIVAGHEAGHAIVAWCLFTWPEVELDPVTLAGNTSRLVARNAHESIAIVMAGIEADRLQGIDSARVMLAEGQDWKNLRTRHPGARIEHVGPAKQLAKLTLLNHRDAWWLIRGRLLVTDFLGWREVAKIATGGKLDLICVQCEEQYDVADREDMTRNTEGQQFCPRCSAQMPAQAKLLAEPAIL